MLILFLNTIAKERAAVDYGVHWCPLLCLCFNGNFIEQIETKKEYSS